MDEDDVVAKLVRLLDQAPTEDRYEITTWLLWVSAASVRRRGWMIRQFTPVRDAAVEAALGTDQSRELLTFSLRSEQHEQLRDWCDEHDFTMPAGVRGLVERFLEDQRPDPALAESAG
jgi:hypothetical protein